MCQKAVGVIENRSYDVSNDVGCVCDVIRKTSLIYVKGVKAFNTL